jgi:hypothetical protein
MPFYRKLGSLPRKRHIAHKAEPGYKGEGIYYEEVVTLAGFGRAYSIVYQALFTTCARRLESARSSRPARWSAMSSISPFSGITISRAAA